ncbi:MAG: hypothetical protein JNK17_07360 [Hydrogenophaga sp.]|nr:hypothetical protein [Hydrogenophaga sp.]
MTTTTFGYHATQDRIWMRVHDRDVTVWFTRRMVRSIVGPMLKLFEDSTPGSQGGAAPRARASIEHQLSLHEVAPGQRPAQIRAGHETPSASSDPQESLCTRITTQATAQGVNLNFETEAGPLVLNLSRKGMHLWYRGLAMVLKQASWDLPEGLPEWLRADMTPPAVQALLKRPLPPDLDDPPDGR